jgi:hypothetical protein
MLSSALKIATPAHKRSTYTERSRQNSRAAQNILAAVNGHSEAWSHDTIRTALLRQAAIEIEDLLEELPRAGDQLRRRQGLDPSQRRCRMVPRHQTRRRRA